MSSLGYPIRSCAVCKRATTQAALLRFVGEKGPDGVKLRLDMQGGAPGRGVYCHPEMACLGQKKTWALLISSLMRGSKKRSSAGLEPLKDVPKSQGGAEIENVVRVLRRGLEDLRLQLQANTGGLRQMRIQELAKAVEQVVVGLEAPATKPATHVKALGVRTKTAAASPAGRESSKGARRLRF